jgi:hypothetical protein
MSLKKKIQEDFLTLEGVTDKLHRNVAKELPL